LLPLKSLAYGVPPHTFIDYFQMSPQYARECCKEFDKAMKRIYMEFLRVPTATDLKNIVKFHKSIHSVDGMIGSLDCTHVLEELSQGLARIVERKGIKAIDSDGVHCRLFSVPMACLVWVHWNLE
jgi:hypothetical protein